MFDKTTLTMDREALLLLVALKQNATSEREKSLLQHAALGLINRAPTDLEKPIEPELLQLIVNQPYWHLSLTGHCTSEWKILDERISKRPQDYRYGARWLAFFVEPSEETKDKYCGEAA